MSKKDRVKPLFDALSSGDDARIRQQASQQLREIREEMAALKRDEKLISELVQRYGGPSDGLSSSERTEKVREAALALAKSGKRMLTTEDVLSYLKEEMDIRLDVKRPGSLVGTVLSKMPEFDQVERNRYRFKGELTE
jgi:hypothetical protein